MLKPEERGAGDLVGKGLIWVGRGHVVARDVYSM